MPAIGDITQRYPLLRLLIPYITGIVLADKTYPHIEGWWTYGAGACALLLCILCIARRRLWISGVTISCFFLLLGGIGYDLSRQHTQYTWPSGEAVYEARITDAPRHRERSTLCFMKITGIRNTSDWEQVHRKVLVYMEPTAEADSLQAGDMICFRGRVKSPQNFSEDLDFDYARYVILQGAAGTVYLPDAHWIKVENESLHLHERMLRLRNTLQTKYMHNVFSDDTLGVLSALTLGDKRGLSKEIRAAYTDAGAAHVLALSGLHVGIIYAMLAFLMRGILRRRNLRWLRELLTIAVLWLFALMVGMTPSVIRAVGMCTLYTLSRWVSHDSNSINALLLAALVMLFGHPLYLFDVGFQLSFMAMAAILWFEPHLEMLFHRSSLHPIPAYFVGIVCMSIAAQLGTFPLTLYHFGTFSTYFLLTNMVVIPYLYVVLLLAMAWWLLILLNIPWAAPLGEGVGFLIGWINDFLVCIGQWPGAVLHVERYNALAALLTYLCILFTGAFLSRRWASGAVLALASLLALLIVVLFS